MTAFRRRRGIASVVGMLFLALIFMGAVGAQVYLSGLQSAAAEGESGAMVLQAAHDREDLGFSGSGSGVRVQDPGPTAVTAVGMVLAFENGTTYFLGNSTSPAFAPSTILPSGSASLQALVPSGTCTPGTATCLSKFNSIVLGGPVAGRGVGVLTSMGNTFWYYPATADAGGSPTIFYRTSSPRSTTSSAYVPISGLAFSGSANTYYEVRMEVAYYQSQLSSPGASFAITVPSGTGFLFCGGMFWSNPATTSGNGFQGNTCTGTAGTSLGTTVSPQTFCATSAGACEFVGVAYVWFASTPGTFQLNFADLSGGTANVMADSTLAVMQAS